MAWYSVRTIFSWSVDERTETWNREKFKFYGNKSASIFIGTCNKIHPLFQVVSPLILCFNKTRLNIIVCFLASTILIARLLCMCTTGPLTIEVSSGNRGIICLTIDMPKEFLHINLTVLHICVTITRKKQYLRAWAWMHGY